MDESRQVYVIGGGPAGLAAAAELRRRGLHPVILERGEQVGTSWRAGYDRWPAVTQARRDAGHGVGVKQGENPGHRQYRRGQRARLRRTR